MQIMPQTAAFLAHHSVRAHRAARFCCWRLQTRGDLPGNIMAMPEPGRENEKYGRFLDQAKPEAALVPSVAVSLCPPA
jgi:hypothetical protein